MNEIFSMFIEIIKNLLDSKKSAILKTDPLSVNNPMSSTATWEIYVENLSNNHPIEVKDLNIKVFAKTTVVNQSHTDIKYTTKQRKRRYITSIPISSLKKKPKVLKTKEKIILYKLTKKNIIKEIKKFREKMFKFNEQNSAKYRSPRINADIVSVDNYLIRISLTVSNRKRSITEVYQLNPNISKNEVQVQNEIDRFDKLYNTKKWLFKPWPWIFDQSND